jgi:acetate kinase
MRILVVNAGSESVKLRVIEDDDQVADTADLGPPDEQLAERLAEFLGGAGHIDAVGHRVVHGGDRFVGPVVVDAAVRKALSALSDLAPLHNPAALAGLDALARLLPDTPAIACFDTAFHADLPRSASTYALPAEWTATLGIRRFGFHGLSCAWATRRTATLLGRPVAALRLVVCHLGGGASATAVSSGRSVDTTMGFTPLEGLVMATRCGDVDPGLLVWLLRHQGLSASELEDGLTRRSGLLGLSGELGDMRAVLEGRDRGDPACALGLSVYLHRLRAKIAAMAAAMQGLDALVFTGGVGENSAVVRAETCARLAWLGVAVDEHANALGAGDSDISTRAAPVRTLVVHAREDLEIARQCRQLL